MPATRYFSPSGIVRDDLLNEDAYPILERWFWSTAFGLGYEVAANTALVADHRNLEATLQEGKELKYSPVYSEVILDASRRRPAALYRAFLCVLTANGAEDLLGHHLAYRLPGTREA